MRVGINQVLIYNRNSGARQREFQLFPEVLLQLNNIGISCNVYISESLSKPLIDELLGDSSIYINLIKTPIPSVPTYRRIIDGLIYWKQRVKYGNLSLFHTSYHPVPKLKIPTILTIHDLRFCHFPNTYKKSRLLFLRSVVPYSISNSNQILTVSNDTKTDLIKYYDVNPRKIAVSYNSVSSKFIKCNDEDNNIEVIHKYKLPKKYLLYVGNLEPRKNLEMLLKAYILLLNDYDIKLVILGKNDWGGSALFDMIHKNKLADKVIFTGYVDDNDIHNVYKNALVLVFPSLHEGFGIPILEAMASGVPVVTSNISAMPEIAGDAAILVNPYCENSIKNGIVKILSSQKIRDNLIAKGIERIRQFSVKKSAKIIVDNYIKLLHCI